jgi:hypothetical protein
VPLRGASIAESCADWTGPRQPEEDTFGTGDPECVAALVDRFCGRWLGSGLDGYEFFFSGVLSVHGVRLLDGRRVMVKAARRSIGERFLSAVQVVQSALAAHGFPCPAPILGPRRIGGGIAFVEEMVCRGSRADVHEPAVRFEMARTLARQVELARPFVSLEGLRPRYARS